MPYLQPVTEGGAPARPKATSHREERMVRRGLLRIVGRYRTALTGLMAFCLMAHSASPLLANPSGEQVVAGQAVFERSLDLSGLTITQGSDRAVINWADFSIGLGETTQFVQPGATSATLNRVMNGLTSHIDGGLLANGQIYLINPNGIIVGPTGRIDVHSFIGSTLDVSDDAFMTGGDLTFAGPSQASVVNFGTINGIGGDVFLIGRSVENHGLLNAPNGTVGLAAGEEVLLRAAGEERLFVQPTAGSGGGGTGVTNTGTIQAATAELKAHGNMYALAINNGGVIRATGVQKKGGRVFLSAPGGAIESSGEITAKDGAGGGGFVKVDASGGGSVKISGKVDAIGDDGTGGEIQITGDTVDILDGAELLASGLTGGGTVLVGGGFQGQDPAVENAIKTFVDYGAVIRADSYQSGDAGFIVVWADDTTEVHGDISARAYGASGDGGFVELSGKKHLKVTSIVDARSENGDYGSLLLDPGSVVLYHDTFGEGGTGFDFFSDLYISSQLEMVDDLTIFTDNATGEAGFTGDIIVESDVVITWTSDKLFRLEAGNSIFFETDEGGFIGPQITSTGEGRMEFVAGFDIEIGNGTLISTAGPGTLLFDAGNNITVDNVGISSSGTGDIDFTAGGRVEFSSTSISSVEGDISVISGHHMNVDNSTAITSSGTGNILLEANFDSDQDESSYNGMFISYSSTIGSADGDVTLRGRAGAGGGVGIYMSSDEGGGGPNISGNNLLFQGIGAPGPEPEGPRVDILIDSIDFQKSGGSVTFNGITLFNDLSTGNLEDGEDWDLVFAGGTFLDLEFEGGAYFYGFGGDPDDDNTFEHTGSIAFNDGYYDFQNGLKYEYGTTYMGNADLWTNGDTELGTVVLTGNSGVSTNGGDIDFGLVDTTGPVVSTVQTYYSLYLDSELQSAFQPEAGDITLLNFDNILDDLIIRGGVVNINNSRSIRQSQSWSAEELNLSATDIVLDRANDFGDVTFNASSVYLRENGQITDGGAWHVSGRVTLLANSEGPEDIILNNPNNDLGAIDILSANNVTIYENGDITQADNSAWDVNQVTLNAGGGTGSIFLNGSFLDEGGNSIYNRLGDLDLVGASLVLIEEDDITDRDSFILEVPDSDPLFVESGWRISGNISLMSSPHGPDGPEFVHSIHLDNVYNVLGDIATQGLVDDLEITDSTEITQSGPWTANAVSLNSQGNAITLGHLNNLGTVSIIGEIPSLVLTEADHIIQGNAWSITGTTTLTARNFQPINETFYDIFVESDLNEFGGDMNVTGNVVKIANLHDITDGAGGFHTGDLTITTFENNNVILNETTNTYGKIFLNGSPLNQLHIAGTGDIEQGGTWSAGETTIIALESAPGVGGNIKLTAGDNVFGDLTLTGASLELNEGGDVTDGGAWTITGLTTINATPDQGPPAIFSVILDNVDNVLGDIALPTQLNNLTITENDDITQSGRWIVNNNVTLNVDHPENSDLHNIYLGHSDNVFGNVFINGVVGELTLTENDSIYQGNDWHTTGDTIINAGTYGVYLWNYNIFGNIGITAGEVYLTEVDDIISGDLLWMVRYIPEGEEDLVGGFVSLNAYADYEDEENPVFRDILLTNANNVMGDISIGGEVDNLTIYENDDITQDSTWWAGTTTLVSTGDVYVDYFYTGEGYSYNRFGDLTITADNAYIREIDDITDGEAWTVTGEVHLKPFANYYDWEMEEYVTADFGIALDNPANVLGSIFIYDEELSSSPTVSTVVIKEAGDLDQGNIWDIDILTVEAGGAINLNFTDGEGGYNTFGDITLKGDSLNLTENDDITDGGAWDISGAVTLDANPEGSPFSHSIILDNPENKLGDITLASQVTDLTIVENGAITQGGAWHTTGTTILTTGIETETEERFAITLLADNRFGNLAVTGGEVAIREIESITGFAQWLTGDLTLDSDGNAIAVTNAENVLGDITLVGAVSNLDLREADDITQAGAWKITNGTIDADGHDIILDDEDNEISGTSFIANNLTFTNKFAITQLGSGPWDIAVSATLDSSGNLISLSNAANTIAQLNIVGAIPSLTFTNNGAITQGSAWNVTGTSTLNSQTNAIILEEQNVLGALHIEDGAASISITEDDDITQANAWKPAGDITLVASGHNIALTNAGNVLHGLALTADTATVVNTIAITQSGDWNVGAISLNSTSNNIILDSSGNHITGAITILGTVPQLVIFNDEDITQSSAWTVTGNTTLLADGADILLNSAANVFADLSVFADGDAEITEAGNITQFESWFVGGTAKLRAGINNIVLEDSENIFGALDLIARNATIFETNDMSIAGAQITEILDITAGNNIAQTGPILVNTLNAQAINGSITLNHAQNKILFLDSIGANTGIDIFEDPGMTIGGTVYSASGNVSIGTFGGNLALGALGSVNAAGAGAQIVLYTDHLFFNNSNSSSPLNTGSGGFWLIYVGANSGSNFGNLNPDFTEFNAPYPTAPGGFGNGILVAVNSPTTPLPDFPDFPTGPGIFIPSPLPGQTGPLISSNPINDFSNVGSGLYVQNEDPEGAQKEYEERYAQDKAQGTTPGTNKDVGPGDGVTQFGSDGTTGIPTGQAPKELLDAFNNPNELQDAL